MAAIDLGRDTIQEIGTTTAGKDGIQKVLVMMAGMVSTVTETSDPMNMLVRETNVSTNDATEMDRLKRFTIVTMNAESDITHRTRLETLRRNPR